MAIAHSGSGGNYRDVGAAVGGFGAEYFDTCLDRAALRLRAQHGSPMWSPAVRGQGLRPMRDASEGLAPLRRAAAARSPDQCGHLPSGDQSRRQVRMLDGA